MERNKRPTNSLADLSRRERQIMDAIYSLGKASVAQVIGLIPDPSGYSSVRKLLQILEEKGHVKHTQEGQLYVYSPTQPRQSAARSAMKQILQTFFGGNVEDAVMTLMSEADVRLSDEDIVRLQEIVDQQAKQECPTLDRKES
jgi:predicted transcriptional regulator